MQSINQLGISNVIVRERTFLTHDQLNITPVNNLPVHAIPEGWKTGSTGYHLQETFAAAMKALIWIEWKLVPQEKYVFPNAQTLQCDFPDLQSNISFTANFPFSSDLWKSKPE